MLLILRSAPALFRGQIRPNGRLLNPILNPSVRGGDAATGWVVILLRSNLEVGLSKFYGNSA